MSWLPPRVLRRVLIDPLWLPVAVLIAAVLLVIAAVGALCAPFSRRRRLLRASCLALVYLAMDVGLMLSSLLLWLRQPGPGRDDQQWRTAHSRLLGRALGRLMAAARALFGYRVELVGRPFELDPDRPVVVLARHAGPGDSFTLVHLLVTRYQRCPRVVLKRALQVDPGLDVVLTRLKCYFLPSKSGAGEDRAEAVADLVGQLTAGDALLLFPEGGNWTPRRHRRSVIRLLRAGRREQARRVRERTHVLPPRPGGTVAALSARADTDVLVVAHTGLDDLVNPRQMWQALPLVDRPMRIRSWLHQAAAVPRDEDGIRGWLDERWAEVDQWVHTQAR